MAVLPPGFERARPILTDELGVTYAADRIEPGQDREVALRLLTVRVPGRPTRRQFRGSCLAVTAIVGHPGVLPVREVLFTAENQPCLVTDLHDGTLAEELAAGPLPVGDALDLAAALARTLAAAHDAGVVHLDVRPANVVTIAGRPEPLLAYFGVSRAIGAADNAELPVACLLYAGRELFGWDIPGPAADVYALASTLHAMLAGQAPYAAEARAGRAALYQRVLRGGPPAVSRPGVPASVGPLIATMMDPNPTNRPTLGEVTETLAAAAAISDPRLAAAAGSARPASGRSTGPIGPAQERSARMAAPAGLTLRADPASDADTAAQVTAMPLLDLAHQPGVAQAAGLAGAQDVAERRGFARRADGAGGRSRSRQRRPAGLWLLVAAGMLALLAGVVWGVVTAPAPQAPRGGPTVRATASARPVNSARLAAYRPTSVRVLARPGAIEVRWTAPANVHGVTAYLVVAESGGVAVHERTVGLAGHRAVFVGLAGGQRYCFVVGALIESAGGQARTAAARPVCATARRARR